MTIYETPQNKNPCYIKARPMSPVGILVHSTGANNKNIHRYVDAPDVLGVNQYGNHWNKATATKMVHAFIGLDKDGEIATAHTLPYTTAAWGCGKGVNGSYNYDPQGHIQFEICEDGRKDGFYYGHAMIEAAEYCAYLCRLFNLPVSSICSHAEAHKKGYAGNHGDPDSWMNVFGEGMDYFRNCVTEVLGDEEYMAEVMQGASIIDDPIYPVLSRGRKDFDESGNVHKLQALLNKYSSEFALKMDGIFGKLTEDAVMSVQTDLDTAITGVTTKEVWDALRNATTATPDVETDPIVQIPLSNIHAIIDALNAVVDFADALVDAVNELKPYLPTK